MSNLQGNFFWVERCLDALLAGKQIDKLPETEVFFEQQPGLLNEMVSIFVKFKEKAIKVSVGFPDWVEIARGLESFTDFDFTFEKKRYVGSIIFKDWNMLIQCIDGEILYNDRLTKTVNVVGPVIGTQDLAVLVLQAGILGTASREEEVKAQEDAMNDYLRRMADPNYIPTLGDVYIEQQEERRRKAEARKARAKAKAEKLGIEYIDPDEIERQEREAKEKAEAEANAIAMQVMQQELARHEEKMRERRRGGRRKKTEE